MVAALLNAGADPDVGRSWGGKTPLHLAAENGHAPVGAGANEMAHDWLGRTAGELAEDNGHGVVERILTRWAMGHV
ncbi:hypothetical protein T484DRAFT_1863458 [Baffinella frigidus]|nr:hypothetical protein T484DRAFT_1863458 [Cryptophyta sp. CCMP2293]